MAAAWGVCAALGGLIGATGCKRSVCMQAGLGVLQRSQGGQRTCPWQSAPVTGRPPTALRAPPHAHTRRHARFLDSTIPLHDRALNPLPHPSPPCLLRRCRATHPPASRPPHACPTPPALRRRQPENILFGEDWTLKVADFGVSIDLLEERAVTRTGTTDYMAPEVCGCVGGGGECRGARGCGLRRCAVSGCRRYSLGSEAAGGGSTRWATHRRAVVAQKKVGSAAQTRAAGTRPTGPNFPPSLPLPRHSRCRRCAAAPSRLLPAKTRSARTSSTARPRTCGAWACWPTSSSSASRPLSR